MNWLNPILLLLAAFLAVYLETSIDFVRNFLRAQIDLLPALMVYTSLTHSFPATVLLAVAGGLWFDSLSANPLGVSILPLLVIGSLNFQNRSFLLRENTYAQFILGLAASAAAPLISLLIIFGVGDTPLLGLGSAWQLIVMSVAGGAATPVLFRFFDRVSRAVDYQPLAESAFRPNREIKRGRM